MIKNLELNLFLQLRCLEISWINIIKDLILKFNIWININVNEIYLYLNDYNFNKLNFVFQVNYLKDYVKK